MALIFPSDATIASFDKWPSEHFLLDFLKNSLDDSFEIYFQSALIDSRPDIVVVRKNYGVLIIEVKDWNLPIYDINSEGDWVVYTDGKKIKSPIKQVLDYKKSLSDLHIEGLLEHTISDLRYNNVVACVVYFHDATQAEIDPLYQQIKNFHKNDLEYTLDILTQEGLNVDAFNAILRKRYLLARQPSFLFNDTLYASFVRYLKPPKHLGDNTSPLHLTSQQLALTRSAAGLQQRIDGVVGSGKSTIIAHRAANAFNRHGGHVLILCFNITLINYIKNRLKQVPQPFDWAYMHIFTYHEFINTKMDVYDMKMEVPTSIYEGGSNEVMAYIDEQYYSNARLFESQNNQISKYDTILIDEVQDYKRPWLELIKNSFLSEQGEYVLLGDVKQNIYDLPIQGKDLITNVIGRPNILKKSYRSSYPLQQLTVNFQQLFFKDKYHIDKLNEFVDGEFDFEATGVVEYISHPNSRAGNAYDIVQLIKKYCVKLNEPPGNITVLGFRISLLREIEAYYRASTGERIMSMFETLEIWYLNLFYHFRNAPFIQEALEVIGPDIKFGKKLRYLAKMVMLQHISEITHEAHIKVRQKDLIDDINISQEWFDMWVKDSELKQILNFGQFRSDHLLASLYQPYSKALQKIKKIRKYKKYHFNTHRNVMKMATVHSFKGWESNTILLILEEQYHTEYGFGEAFFEVIYTAITRAHTNLIVLNYGNTKHDAMLKKLFSE